MMGSGEKAPCAACCAGRPPIFIDLPTNDTFRVVVRSVSIASIREYRRLHTDDYTRNAYAVYLTNGEVLGVEYERGLAHAGQLEKALSRAGALSIAHKRRP